MKHFALLSLFAAFLLLPNYNFAQCPVCIPEDCSADAPQGGQCDTVLVNGMAGQAYQDKYSFYLPTQLEARGFEVRFIDMRINAVIGIPPGLNWSTNLATGLYVPPTGDTIGCVSFCGSPLISGTFNFKIRTTARILASTPVGDLTITQDTSYFGTITILPDTSGNVTTFSNDPPGSRACDSVTYTFDALIDGAPDPTDWEWDFGNGQSSTAQNPAPVTYTDAGDYDVTLTTTVYEYVITRIRIDNVNSNYQPDIEEVTTLQNPDLYVVISSLGFSNRGAGSNSTSETYSNLSIVVPPGTTSFGLQVWDEDTGPPQGTNILGSGDDLLGTATVQVREGTFNWSQSGNSGTITMITRPRSVTTETLEVTLSDSPEVPEISPASDTICSEGSAILSIVTDIDNFIQWYRNGSAIPSANQSELTVLETATYSVDVISPSGCISSSAPRLITVVSPPDVPEIIEMAGSQLSIPVQSDVTVQWYFDGSPITGANDFIYDADATGQYWLTLTNDFGCVVWSDTLFVEACTPPTTLQAFDIGENSAKLSWSCDAPFEQFILRGNVVGRPGFATLNLPAGCPAFKLVNGLDAGTSYWWQVKKICDQAGTESDWSEPDTFTTDLICRIPNSLLAINITARSARLTWDAVPGAIGYHVRGRASGGSWTDLNVTNSSLNTGNILQPATTYEWHVEALCPDGEASGLAALAQFVTGSNKTAGENIVTDRVEPLKVYPNPASQSFIIQLAVTDEPATIEVVSIDGKIMHRIEKTTDNQLQINCQQWPAGMYSVQLHRKGSVQSRKLIVY